MKNKAFTLIKGCVIAVVLIFGVFISNPAISYSQCVNPADLINNTLEVCFGEVITFCPEVEPDICYKWLPESAFLLGESTFPNPTTSPITEDVEIHLIKTDDKGNIIEKVVIDVIVNDFDLDLTEVHETCQGESITLSVTPSGGSGNYVYSWNTGETTSSITVAPTESTLYTVEIKDVEQGCTLVVSRLVRVTPSPEISIDPSHSTICLQTLPGLTGNPDKAKDIESKNMLGDCQNNSVELSVISNEDINGYGFEWSTGETTPTVFVDQAGEYSVTISNGACVSTAAFELTSCAQVSAELDIEYNGQNWGTILDAGEGFASYEWQDGSTEQTIIVTEPGEYSVTVYSEEGCIGKDETVIICHYTIEKVKQILCHDTPVPFKLIELLECPFGVMIPTSTGSSLPTFIDGVMSFDYEGKTFKVKVSGPDGSNPTYESNLVYSSAFVTADIEKNALGQSTGMKFSLYLKDEGGNKALEFESSNMGDIIALIKVLCFEELLGEQLIIEEMIALLEQNEGNCDELDAILSGASDDFIKNHITDNKKIEYINVLVECSTCNFIVDERLIVLNLLKGFNDNFLLDMMRH